MIVDDRRLLGRGSGSRRLQRVAGAVCVAVALASGAAAAQAAEPGIPNEIQVLAGNKLFLAAHATGVQSYDCVAVADGDAWSAPTPRANLYADNGRLVATHYGGPTWEARDGSMVVGRKEAGVTVDSTAIQWLRLAAASTSAGPDGGRLAGTTYIQRIATVGGL